MRSGGTFVTAPELDEPGDDPKAPYHRQTRSPPTSSASLLTSWASIKAYNQELERQ
jgi:hypothetical protein